MATGIRATVEFSSPDCCPLLERAEAADATVDSTTSTVGPTDGDAPVTDVTVTGDLDEATGLSTLFTGGGSNRYRLVRDGAADPACPCECLGGLGVPVDRYVVREGVLRLVFYADDYDELEAVVGALRKRYPGVNIKRLVRSPTGDRPRDGVFVDRSRLTDRQLEVLETALDMGYFERPRQANATAVARALDIAPSTFSEHLAVAQRKLFEAVLERGR